MVNLEEIIEQRKKDPAWELKIARGVLTARRISRRKKSILAVTVCSLFLLAGSAVFFTVNREESLKNNLDSVLSETLPHFSANVVISKGLDSKIDQYCMAVVE